METPDAPVLGSDSFVLQFGHGSVAVETLNCVSELAQASKLQFGHGSVAVETADSCVLNSNAVSALQFGHGSVAVETTCGLPPP